MARAVGDVCSAGGTPKVEDAERRVLSCCPGRPSARSMMQMRSQGEFEEGTFATQGGSGQRARQARHEQSRGGGGRRSAGMERSVDGGRVSGRQ